MMEQGKNIMIGLFVISALMIIAFIMLFLHPSVGNEGRLLRVRFANIDKVSVGTRVTFAGKPAGEVVAIHEIDFGDDRLGRNGHVYIYELDLLVDSSVTVYETDEISLRTSGLLGEKSVAIVPRPIPKGQPMRLADDLILYADETGSVEDTFKEFKEVADRFDVLLDEVSDIMTEVKREKLIHEISEIARNVNSVTGALNNPEKVKSLLDDTYILAHNLRETSHNLLQDWPLIKESIHSIKETSLHLKDISREIQEGSGTLNKLIYSDDFYLRTTSTISKAETLLNDMNHYGILFHLDKGWQRLRARRMNLLQKLSTPQEFRNFFNDEIDLISTSLSRVSDVMQKIYSYCGPLADNEEFKKVFSELLRRTSELEENVKMYNQQVMDEAVQQTELVSY